VSIRYKAPDGYQRQIQEISPRYFIGWNQLIDRWEVRAWTHPRHFKPSPYKIEELIRRGEPSYLIRRCFKQDHQGRDVAFRPLDYSFIVDNQIGFYNTQQVKRLLAAIDAHNKTLAAQVASQEDYEHRAAAKAIYKHLREPSVYLGGN